VVGVLVEEQADLLPVGFQLGFQCVEGLAQAHRQEALGCNDGRSALELVGTSKDFQPPLRGVWTPEFMSVEEPVPSAFLGFDQRGGRWKFNDKLPTITLSPVVKSLESRRIIFTQGLLKLADQRGALFDERHLIAAQEAQLLRQGVQRLEGRPSMSIHAQSVGKSEGVGPVGFVAAGAFALTIAFGSQGVERINSAFTLEQLIYGRALACFNRYGQCGIRFDFIAECLPPVLRMFDLELGDDGSLAVDDHQIVMILGPVEAGVMSDFIPCFHAMLCGCSHRGAVGSQPDTRSLAGYCSLRLCESRRRAVR